MVANDAKHTVGTSISTVTLWTRRRRHNGDVIALPAWSSGPRAVRAIRIGYKNISGYRPILQRISRCDALFNLPDLKLEQEGCQPLRENNKGQSILQTRQECDLRVSRSYFNPAPRQARTLRIFASILRTTIDCIFIFALRVSGILCAINSNFFAMSCSVAHTTFSSW